MYLDARAQFEMWLPGRVTKRYENPVRLNALCACVITVVILRLLLLPLLTREIAHAHLSMDLMLKTRMLRPFIALKLSIV